MLVSRAIRIHDDCGETHDVVEGDTVPPSLQLGARWHLLQSEEISTPWGLAADPVLVSGSLPSNKAVDLSPRTILGA